MNTQIKILLVLVALLTVAFWGGFINITTNTLGGVPANGITYSSATNTSINCSGAVATLVAATSSGRTKFSVSASSTDVSLCYGSAGCTDGAGRIIKSTTPFEQDDGYIGAYYCFSRGGVTSTIGVISN